MDEVGPPANYAEDKAWPTDRDIETVRRSMTLVPPKGAVFGATEVFYLDVRDTDRERAVALNRAICDQLQARFQNVLDVKAQSMIVELDKTVRLAKADLNESTGRLMTIEKQVGGDLAELRILHEGAAGDGLIRRTISEIENELRQARSAGTDGRQLLSLLQAAEKDPGQLLVAPSRLLDSQPALKRLKDGLVDAQLRTAHLQGSMSSEHPLVVAAHEAESEIGNRLHNELAIAVRGAEADLRLNRDRTTMLENQLAQVTSRLSTLASLRAVYANQVSETGQRTKIVERAEQNLAEARAAGASAKAASLISRIDGPDTGIKPVSPSRAMIVLVGVLGGLATGLGVVFLTVQSTQPAPVASAAAAPAAVEPVMEPVMEPATVEPPAILTSAAVAATPLSVLRANGNLSLKRALETVACRAGA